ncbi:MAG: SusD/RagB family nutrient-binding outer membrane lipoprotein [Ferruginibacter sp.]
MKRIFLSISALSMIVIAGCKKNFLDINQNPNSATFSTAQLTMPIALEGTGRYIQQSYIGGLGMWVGYYATPNGFSKPNETYTYDISNTYLATVWDNLYNNITDLDYVEKQAAGQNLPVYRAIAKVMKAYDYHQLVDLWDNVPYTEALQGSNNFAPKYDKGQAIYEDLVKQIDTAIAIFKTGGAAASVSVSADRAKIIMFNNYLTSAAAIPTFLNKWVKFSNTLKLMLLMNQSQMPGRDTYIKGELAGLTRADFLDLTEDALVNPVYQDVAGKYSPFFSVFVSAGTQAAPTYTDSYKSIKASDYAITTYTNNGDTLRRAFYYTKPANNANWVGTIFGDPAGIANPANIGTPILSSTAGAPTITASESLFLQAEAVQRGYITGTAQTLYQDAIVASFTYDKIPNAAAAAAVFYNQPNAAVNWTLATDKIALIIGQKWAALNSIDILSVYNDYRRTGFPPVPLSTDASSKGKIPVRMLYPQRELQLNTANVNAEGTIAPLTQTVFWDK